MKARKVSSLAGFCFKSHKHKPILSIRIQANSAFCNADVKLKANKI